MLFTICALFFGDYPDYAKRCLTSLQKWGDYPLISDFRFGLNAVSDGVKSLIESAAREIAAASGLPVRLYEPRDKRNFAKYPLMRVMFYDSQVPPLSDLVMWFDDDSALTSQCNIAWWSEVAHLMARATLIGSEWKLKGGFRPGQEDGIKQQAWYAGKPIPERILFATGGWWVGRSEFLRKWSYPFVELYNNGGDSILSELCRQQEATRIVFKKGVLVNSAMPAGPDSSAKRRGEVSKWPWETGSSHLADTPLEVTVRTFASRLN